MERPTYIYALIDPRTAEVRYVGKAENLTRRLKQHLRDHSKTHRAHWIQSLRTLGLNPLIETLEVATEATWQEREKCWIAALRAQGCNLTNGTDGGDGVPGYKPTSEQIERHRQAITGRKATPEQLDAQSAATKGVPKPLNHPCHLGTFRGRKHTDEAKAKMRLAKLGKCLSPEHIAKMAMANSGHAVSQETRDKIRDGQHRRYADPSERLKQSVSATRRYTDPAQRKQARQIAIERETRKKAEREKATSA